MRGTVGLGRRSLGPRPKGRKGAEAGEGEGEGQGEAEEEEGEREGKGEGSRQQGRGGRRGGHPCVAFLDTDVGQPEFTPPGLVSLHLLSHPVFGRYFFSSPLRHLLSIPSSPRNPSSQNPLHSPTPP
ncbi:unnamed protein product [Closterium sp. NIES-54]